MAAAAAAALQRRQRCSGGGGGGGGGGNARRRRLSHLTSFGLSIRLTSANLRVFLAFPMAIGYDACLLRGRGWRGRRGMQAPSCLTRLARRSEESRAHDVCFIAISCVRTVSYDCLHMVINLLEATRNKIEIAALTHPAGDNAPFSSSRSFHTTRSRSAPAAFAIHIHIQSYQINQYARSTTYTAIERRTDRLSL